MKKSGASQGQSASELISKRIAELGDWRGKTLSRMRKLVKEADPDVVEEWKWMGTPIWSHDGIICTGESYKSVVKLTFSKGASLEDPARLFNSSLDGNVRRAIDIHEGEEGRPGRLFPQSDLLHEVLVVPEQPLMIHGAAFPMSDRRHADREALSGGGDRFAVRCRHRLCECAHHHARDGG